MAIEPKYKKGDWIRFLSLTELTIGEVAYVNVAEFPKDIGVWYVTTNAGMIDEVRVLEVRPAAPLSEIPNGQ